MPKPREGTILGAETLFLDGQNGAERMMSEGLGDDGVGEGAGGGMSIT